MDELIPIKRLLIAILVLMTFATIYFAKDVLLPVVIGLLLAATLSPIVRMAERRGLPPPITAAALILSICLGLGAAVLLLGGSVAAWVDQAPQIGAQLRVKLSALTDSLRAVQDASDQVETLTEGTSVGVQKVVLDQPGLLNTAVSGAAAFGTSLIVGIVLAFFFLASGSMFAIKMVQTYSRLNDKKRAIRIVQDIQRRISHYLLSITLINAGLGIAIALALYAIGLPYWWLWGGVAFVLNFLPFLGAVSGWLVVAAFSLVTFDSLSYAFVAPVAYMTLTSIEGQFVTPHLLGRKLDLNTVSVFLTVVFWGWLWGVPGALMAVPFLVCLKVICDHVEGMEWLGNFLSGHPVAPRKNGDKVAAE